MRSPSGTQRKPSRLHPQCRVEVVRLDECVDLILIGNHDIGVVPHEIAERIAREISDDVWIVAPETDQSGVAHAPERHLLDRGRIVQRLGDNRNGAPQSFRVLLSPQNRNIEGACELNQLDCLGHDAVRWPIHLQFL